MGVVPTSWLLRPGGHGGAGGVCGVGSVRFTFTFSCMYRPAERCQVPSGLRGFRFINPFTAVCSAREARRPELYITELSFTHALTCPFARPPTLVPRDAPPWHVRAPSLCLSHMEAIIWTAWQPARARPHGLRPERLALNDMRCRWSGAPASLALLHASSPRSLDLLGTAPRVLMTAPECS